MEPKYPEIIVRLSGEDGNAFFMISRTIRALKKAKVPQEKIEEFRKEAESGDYSNVIETIMKTVNVL